MVPRMQLSNVTCAIIGPNICSIVSMISYCLNFVLLIVAFNYDRMSPTPGPPCIITNIILRVRAVSRNEKMHSHALVHVR